MSTSSQHAHSAAELSEVLHQRLPRPFIDQILRTQALVGGRWVEAASQQRFAVDNPATGKALAQVVNCDEAEVSHAIDAAQNAFAGWRNLSGKGRAVFLRRWFDLIMAHREALGALMTLEQGKPFPEACGEVSYGASFVEWFAEEGKRVNGSIPSSPWDDKRLWVMHQPVGVSAAITPWNFPVAMITRKVAPALAAGCPVIVKPPSQTPLCALALGSLAMQAGIPAGVVQILPSNSAGSQRIGAALCASDVVRKLSFTGSTQVGRQLMAQSAPTIKKLSLELGGHAPAIVCEDADLDLAVEGTLAAKFRNAGQTCVCVNRVYVHESLYDKFLERLSARAAALVVDDGFAPGAQIGPLIDDAALEKVERHVADALAHGASLVTGGKRHAKGGRYFQPTVLRDVTPSMLCMREETFGPVVPVCAFDDEADMLRQANGTPYGLAAYLFTQNLGRGLRLIEALEFGIVGVNTGIVSNEVGPFGGMKQSGLGREGSHEGIEAYLETQYVCVAL